MSQVYNGYTYVVLRDGATLAGAPPQIETMKKVRDLLDKYVPASGKLPLSVVLDIALQNALGDTFIGMTDTPAAYGGAHLNLQINAANNALEFIDLTGLGLTKAVGGALNVNAGVALSTAGAGNPLDVLVDAITIGVNAGNALQVNPGVALAAGGAALDVQVDGITIGTNVGNQLQVIPGIGLAAGGAALDVQVDGVTVTVSGGNQLQANVGGLLAPASANDFDPGGALRVYVTGAVQINRIVTAGLHPSGMLYMIFDQNLTVQHGVAAAVGFAGIRLAGSLNFTTPPHGVDGGRATLALAYDGANMQEVGRKGV